MFNTTSKAERQRIYAEEAQQARIRPKRDRVERHGYGSQDGLVDEVGGYGVSLHPDEGTVTLGDADLEAVVTLPLAGARARLETLAEARDRVTAGRVAALGVLAFAVPKRDRRRVLVIESANAGEAVLVVDGSNEAHLWQWVAWFNRRGAAAGSGA